MSTYGRSCIPCRKVYWWVTWSCCFLLLLYYYCLWWFNVYVPITMLNCIDWIMDDYYAHTITSEKQHQHKMEWVYKWRNEREVTNSISIKWDVIYCTLLVVLRWTATTFGFGMCWIVFLKTILNNSGLNPVEPEWFWEIHVKLLFLLKLSVPFNMDLLNQYVIQDIQPKYEERNGDLTVKHKKAHTCQTINLPFHKQTINFTSITI